MKLTLSFFACFCTLALQAQKMPDYGLNKVRLNFADKVVQAELLPQDVKPSLQNNKLYYWYSANQINSTQGGFSGRLLQGTYREYFLNKSLKEQGFFKKGLKNGEWKNWNEQGKLLTVYNWRKGVKSGSFQLYGDSALKQSGYYKQDLLHGVYKTYHGKDSVEVKKYKKGILLPAKTPSKFWQKIKFWDKAQRDSSSNKVKPVKKKKVKAADTDLVEPN